MTVTTIGTLYVPHTLFVGVAVDTTPAAPGATAVDLWFDAGSLNVRLGAVQIVASATPLAGLRLVPAVLCREVRVRFAMLRSGYRSASLSAAG